MQQIRRFRWAIAIGVVAIADVLALFAVVITGVQENCGNGISRWSCSPTIRDVAPPTFWLLLLALIALAGWRLVRWWSRGP